MRVHGGGLSISRLLVGYAAISIAAMLCPALAAPQAVAAAQSEPLVRGVVDDSNRVTLRGSVLPLVKTENDLGAVEDSFPVNSLYLTLKRSSQQELALGQFLQDAHTPGTASYHQWLTPDEFGRRFGAADSDVTAVSSWLESHGFAVNKVHPGRFAIEFSGNAAQIKDAFRTEIHRYSVRGQGETIYANAGDPQIPAAFSALVAGVLTGGSVRAQPAIRVTGKASYNPKTHLAAPAWTYPASSSGVTFELAPADFAMQYDLASVYKAGTTGAGQSIGILSYSNVDLSLVQAYQALFGLPANLPTVVVDGNDPGQNDDATEAYLDLEQAGAVAPGASVVMYTSAGSVLTDPLLTSGLRALEDNQVSVLSVSYTECEASLGATGNAAWAALWQEAAAQGITVFVATGDAGSAGCDDFNTESFAESGLAVNGLGSTPYNVSVGGTDFYYSSYAAAPSTLNSQIATYWNTVASTSPAVSLLQVAPEQVWNEPFGLNADDAGIYNAGYSTIVGGGGGASGAAIYPLTGPATGYSKPAWQTGAGVPADKLRDVPDIALFAGNGSNYVEYPICAAPGDCAGAASGTAVPITSVGGTSGATPSMAAIQALVNQATKSRQGQADYVYYALANKTLTAKPFRDVIAGGNEVPCFAGTANCALGASGPANGYYAESGFAAVTGYDRASGLGTVDAANLIANWDTATFQSSTTTLSITPASFAHGTAVVVTTSVAPKSGSGAPTGSVVLNSTDPIAGSNGLDLLALTSGAASGSVNDLPGGSYQVIATYSGDSTYAASSSTPVSLTVTPEQDTLSNSAWVVNPTDGSLYPLQPGLSIPYGSAISVDIQPVGINETAPALGQNTPATGAITFTDKTGTTTITATVPLNSEGIAEWEAPAPAIGSHTISAAYAGDASYLASTLMSAAAFTIFRGTTTIYLQPMEMSVAAGSNVTVDLLIYSDVLPLNGQLPTGSVTVTLGGQSQTVSSPFKSWGTTGSAIEEIVTTFASAPAGILPLSATYSGDTFWYGTTTLFGSVQSLAAKPAPALTLASTATSFTPSQTVVLSGSVTGTAALGGPKGSITLTWEDGSNSSNVALLAASGSSATWSLGLPAVQMANGSNTFIATFPGDTNYSSQSSPPLTVTLNASDFSLLTTTQEVAITPGNTGTGSVVITPINSYTGTVAITCSAPTGITCAATTATPTVGVGVTDAITFTVASGVAGGTYRATVTVAGGGHTHTAQILVAYTPITVAPTFSPTGGSYSATQTVTVSDATPAAVLYCTADGSTPTASSAICSNPITVKSTETLKAVALAPGYSLSAVTSATYTVAPQAASPTFSPAGGTYATAQTVTISDATAGATIYYTTNGTTATASSSVYSGAIAVGASETINAIAAAAGYSASVAASATYTINSSGQGVAQPVFSVAGGTYFTQQTVAITDSTSGAVIRYSLNGTTPTNTSTIYSTPLLISNSETLQAIAQTSGGTASNVTSATYALDAAAPVFNPPSGTYPGPLTVTISSTTTTAKIAYTPNGNAPTTFSYYTAPITFTASGKVYALAQETGFTASPTTEAIYTIEPVTAAPVFSLAAGTYSGAQSVTISDATAGATIYYTLNGSTPTASSQVYAGPITVGASETLSAIATATGYSSSTVVSTAYIINTSGQAVTPPVFNVAGGTYFTQQTVTISDASSGAKIYYSLNGTTPTNKSSIYTAPVLVANSSTLQAIAQDAGGTQSSVASATYTLDAVAPTFNPPSGTYPGPLTVTITSATPTAKISYTPNGNAPTVFASYTAPISVTASGKVYALAQETGFTASATTDAVYTIQPAADIPVISVQSGNCKSILTVTLSDTTPGATLYFTTDGTQPSSSSARYTGPVAVHANETLKAVAVASGFSRSSIGSAGCAIPLS